MRKAFLPVITVAISACATSPAATTFPTPSSTTQPVPVSAEQPNMNTGSWRFAYTLGVYSYKIKTKATVESQGITNDLPEREDRVTINLLSADSMAVLEPAIVSGVLECGTPEMGLRMRARYILPKLPRQLVSGTIWNDSVETRACYKTAPTSSTWLHTYTVEGKTTFGGRDAVLVKRASRVTGKGNAIEGQHNILINASGVDSVSLFVDPDNGKFLGAISNQIMDIVLTASGQTQSFKQTSKQTITLF